MLRSLCAIVALISAAPTAAAQQPESLATESIGRLADPNIDRTWISPTAITQPAGSIEFNDFEILLLGVTYGVIDQLQLSAVAVPPMVSDQPYLAMGSVKLAVVPSGKLRLAAAASLFVFGEAGNDVRWVASLGPVASLCLDDTCESLFTAGAFAAFADEGQTETPVGFSASLMARLSRRLKLLIEVDSAAIFGGGGGDTFVHGALLNYGLRITTGDVAVDIGFIRPVGGDVNDAVVLGWPLLAFTYRAR